ncbi:MAG: laccase domain-containing protein [Actinobacteria bacterium]|uniref:Unannotated protein n=1 Tax=freshwater metagenome TaxID=449393 RepID=A0A6J6PEA2_9ZZZZ|nr:laccase domain-containing protein [Actinomycetota bacterium]
MIPWQAEGPYAVAFTTRNGGVSEGPFDSLNLGGQRDEPHNIAENRRRACAEIGADAMRLAVNRQRHTAIVHAAEDVHEGQDGDAIWVSAPGVPILALTADCVPIAVARRGDHDPRLAVVHAGWRGLASGIVHNAAAVLGDGPLQAAIGPAIGPCCYEVGTDVSNLFDADLTRACHLDLWAAAERALQNAGVETITRIDLCTRCNPNLFYSHRRDGELRGVQGVIGAVTL